MLRCIHSKINQLVYIDLSRTHKPYHPLACGSVEPFLDRGENLEQISLQGLSPVHMFKALRSFGEKKRSGTSGEYIKCLPKCAHPERKEGVGAGGGWSTVFRSVMQDSVINYYFKDQKKG